VCVSPAWQALGKTALQSEYSAVLCRLWGRGWQSRCRAGLGTAAQHDGALAGLCRPGGGVACPGGDHRCLWIPGLKGSSHADPAGLRGGSLG
jgi:hypothetical protein